MKRIIDFIEWLDWYWNAYICWGHTITCLELWYATRLDSTGIDEFWEALNCYRARR